MLDMEPSISLEPIPEMDKPLNIGLAKFKHLAVGRAYLSADGGGEAEAHSAESPGSDDTLGKTVLERETD